MVDLDQQKKMVIELDGHIMRCVRDQNGNHVIQKCIECIPEDAIHFIVSKFFDQVVTLSTHPYGCHVIQVKHLSMPISYLTYYQILIAEGHVSLIMTVLVISLEQRVLEHCHDPKTQQLVMDEIMQSICMLAQDQYGNYVVQVGYGCHGLKFCCFSCHFIR